MNNSRFSVGEWFARTGVTVGAAALLVTGGWYRSAAPGVAAQSVSAPSVVTIRVEGKASRSSAPFQLPDGPDGELSGGSSAARTNEEIRRHGSWRST